MLSRAAVLLTPSDSIRPHRYLFITPRVHKSFFATLTSRPQIIENGTYFKSFPCHSYRLVTRKPCIATHTKTTGVYTNNSHSGTWPPFQLLALKAISRHNAVLRRVREDP